MSSTQPRPASTQPDPGDELLAGVLALLGPWGVLGALRSAVELYGESGDPNDVLSSTQVDQLCKLAEYFDLP